MKVKSFVICFSVCSLPFLISFFIYYYNNKIEGTALFVIAHPDDEIIFFGPSILNSEKAFVLSLSKGIPRNKTNKNERVFELYESCKVLGIENQCFVDEKERLKDGFNETWGPEIVKEIVIEYILKVKPDKIITFDEFGVSYHPNHIAVNKGIVSNKEDFEKALNHTIDIKQLNTGLWISKYLGVLNLFYQFIVNLFSVEKKKNFYVIPIEHFINATHFQSFFKHKSQNIWYRYLYLVFSKFQYYNIYC